MVLFFADMHFGRPESGRAVEADLLACLAAHRETLEALYLVGDVFDHFVEYKHVVPKGFARLQGWLAAATDAGLPVTYVVGNHDPWHLDYWTNELGVRLVRDRVTVQHDGQMVHIEHGDAVDASSSWGRRLRPLVRHALPVTLYRNLLPGDGGYALARWASHRFSTSEPDAETAVSLHRQARYVLRTTDADLVVMGHSHTPALMREADGAYANPGAWYRDRTYVALNADGVQLHQWRAGRVLTYTPPPAPQPAA